MRISCGRNARPSEFYGPLGAVGGRRPDGARRARARQLHALVRPQLAAVASAG